MGRVPRWKVFTDTVKNNAGDLMWISEENVGWEAAERTSFSAQGLGAWWQFRISDFGFRI
jgi:hypothetical protein